MPLRNDTFLNGWGDFFRNQAPSVIQLSVREAPWGLSDKLGWKQPADDGSRLFPLGGGGARRVRGAAPFAAGCRNALGNSAAAGRAYGRRRPRRGRPADGCPVIREGNAGDRQGRLCGRRFPAGAAGAKGTAVTARRAPGAGCPARRRDRRARPCAARPAFPPPAPPPCLPEPPPGLRAPPPLRLSPLFGGVPGGRPTGTFDCLFLTDSIESPPGQLYYRIDLFRQIK